MPMRLVSRQLYIGEEARPIFNAGLFRHEPYYIPPEDVPSLDRRRFGMEFVALAAISIAMVGAAQKLWSDWWLVGAVLLLLLAPVVTARWVRQRFQPVTDPSVRRDVRRTAILQAPSVRAAIFMCLVLSTQWLGIALGQHREWITFGLVSALMLIQVITALAQARERREVESEYVPPSSGVTR